MNEVAKFEEENFVLMESFAGLDNEIKRLTELQKSTKEQLLKQMEKYGVKSIDNNVVKITKIEPSESVSVDLKTFQKKEPVNYAQLLEDYPKVTKRKTSIRITVKK